MEKPCRKCAANASPTPILILVNNAKQSLHARNYFQKKMLKRALSNDLKKVNFNFSSEPSPF